MGAVPLVIVGATASGKSAVAFEVARFAGDAEIVTADSMQVYRGMDVGTAKPSSDERFEIRHHLLDVASPDEDYSVARYQHDVRGALADIAARGKRAVIVGGTGLYVRAIVDDLAIPGRWPDVRAELEADPDTAALFDRLAALDPVAAGRTEHGNRRRIVRALEVTLGSGTPFSAFGPGLEAYPPVQFHVVGLRLERADLDARIARRFAGMMGAGLLDEVRALAARGMSPTARQALGYRELLAHIEDGRPLDDCIDEAIRRTRKFARRQESWFRRDPRIDWLAADPENPVAVGARVLGDWEQRCRTSPIPSS